MRKVNYFIVGGVMICLLAAIMLTVVFNYKKDNKNPSRLKFSTCYAKVRQDDNQGSTLYSAKSRIYVVLLSRHKGTVEFSGEISDGHRVYHSAKRYDFSWSEHRNYALISLFNKEVLPTDNTADAPSPLPNYFGFGNTKWLIQQDMMAADKLLVSRNGTPLFVMNCKE